MTQHGIIRRMGGILVCVAIGAALPLLLAATEACDDRPQDGCDTVPTALTVPVVSPDIPAMSVFAGDTIRFDRADLRERMDREQCAFAYTHTTTMLLVKRANRYFPAVEPILREEGVPDDFKYLMVIESSMDEQARSPAGAAGLWQFMTATAREYGLEVNAQVDERYHLERATRAACRYLKEAYAKYGHWLTVAASYNAGQGRVTRELARQQVDKATDLWLNAETSRYMFRLLAVKEVLTDPQRFGFRLRRHQLYPPLPCRYVEVDTAIASLPDWAARHGLTTLQLKQANPWLRDYTLPNKSRRRYRIALPEEAGLHYRPTDTPVHYAPWVIDAPTPATR